MNIALILKPTHWGPATAAFFARGPTGGVLPSSVREFAVEPLKTEASKPVSVEGRQFTDVEEPARGELTVSAGRDFAFKYKALATRKLTAHPPKLRRVWVWAFCTALVLAILAAFLYGLRPSPAIKLQAHAIAPGQVRIEWTDGPGAVSDGILGVLEIHDGDAVTNSHWMPSGFARAR